MNDFADYKQSVRDSYYIGYVSLSFRYSNNPMKDMYENFILNSYDDTWFRRVNGDTKGYGLAIQEIKVTSKNTVTMGDYICYKVKINHIDWYDDEYIKMDYMWLMIHKDWDLEEVMCYIKNNMSKWKP